MDIMEKPSFPADLLQDILKEFLDENRDLVKRLAEANNQRSLSNLSDMLFYSQSNWMNWQDAIAALKEGKPERILERAERVGRLVQLSGRVIEHHNSIVK
jgi:hypothetical protein